MIFFSLIKSKNQTREIEKFLFSEFYSLHILVIRNFFFGESLLSIFRTDLFLKNGSIHLIMQDIFCFVNSGIFSLKSRYLRKMRFTQISLRRIEFPFGANFSWPLNLYLILPLVKTFSLCSHSKIRGKQQVSWSSQRKMLFTTAMNSVLSPS